MLKTGRAKDIAIGHKGGVWVLGMDNVVWRWNGRNFNRGNGAGYAITIGNYRVPWVIGIDHSPWMRVK
ncbi:hypothetical protein ACFL35_16730 [Candidatus Riflebacteria bacterium]